MATNRDRILGLTEDYLEKLVQDNTLVKTEGVPWCRKHCEKSPWRCSPCVRAWLDSEYDPVTADFYFDVSRSAIQAVIPGLEEGHE